MRVLGVCRISKEREESTAIVRQKAAIEAWAVANGHEVVGWATDEGVSGTVNPWDRPALGKWLNKPGKPQPETFGEWDAVVVWRLDRLSRRVIPLRQTLDFLTDSGKTVISTTEGFDPATPMGRIFITILAALAEGELEAIKERNRNTAQHLIKTGGDRGSLPPYGYMRDGLGGLVPDPETVEELNRVVDRLLEGHSVNSTRLWANENGILTPKDAHWRAVGKFPRVKNGEAQEPYKWTVSTFRRMLSSRALLGEAQTVGPDGQRRTVLTAEGAPVMRAEPILSVERFNALQTALDGRTREVKKRRGSSPMLGVGFCACGAKLHIRRYRNWDYYMCAEAAKKAGGCPEGVKPVRCERFHVEARAEFLAAFGDLPMVRRVFVPGEDHTEELETVTQRLASLDRAFKAGAYDSDAGVKEYADIRRALNERREALAAMPSVPSRWEDQPTGQTWQDVLSTALDEEMGDRMREGGISAVLRNESALNDSRVSVEWSGLIGSL